MTSRPIKMDVEIDMRPHIRKAIRDVKVSVFRKLPYWKYRLVRDLWLT